MMKTSSLSVFLCVLMSTALLQAADLTEIPIASGSNLDNPDIDGQLVTWQGGSASTGTDIFWKILADPNDPNTVSITGEQISPSVSGNIIAWQDNRYGTSDAEIYWQDVLLYGDPSYPMGLTLASRQYVPSVSGDSLIWQDRRNGNWDIYGYNIATDTHLTICTETTSEYAPVISGNTVVWRDGRDNGYTGNDIYMSVITGSSASTPVAVSPANVEQYRPAIDGTIIVWEEVGSGTVDLVAYDLSVPGIIWTRTVTTTVANPDISGSIVVWQQGSVGDYDIMGYDLDSGADYTISTGIEDDQKPAVSGRKVVWARNGTHIVGAEIPVPTQIEVLSPNGGEMFLAGSEMLITWGLVNGTPPAQVDIEFLDAGGDPNVFAEDIPFADGQYLWTPIADVNSIDACRIRVTDDASNPTISDLSDNVFSIFQCSKDLTADLNGDCLVNVADLAEFARQWLTCGNPYDPTWCFN